MSKALSVLCLAVSVGLIFYATCLPRKEAHKANAVLLSAIALLMLGFVFSSL